ncbi:MAG: ATP-binding protein, partial [Deefgea sp.]
AFRQKRHNTDETSEEIDPNKHPIFSKNILNGDLIIAHSVRHHQLTWPLYPDIFSPQNTFSALIIPIRIGSETRGFLCFEYCKKQHNWTSNEIQYGNQLAIIAARGIGNIDLGNFLNEIADLNTKLIQSNDALELRVSERTKELASAMAHLIQSEKLASLGNLVAGFAHELNTPLGNTLTASSTLLEKNNELIEQINLGKLKKSLLDQYLTESTMTAQLIERNARRASNLILNLKQVAVDTASSKVRNFNLHQIISETLVTLSPSLKHKHVKIENNTPSHIQLNSYPGSLEQIITNLVNNAIIHAFIEKDNSLITVDAEEIDESTIKIIVKDNGCGIADSIKSKVFDPFFTTKFGQGGSGLGLYLAYSLVTGTLGGQLQLETSEGLGSTFIITIPKQAPTEQDQSNDLHRH